MKLLLVWLINAVALLGVSYLMPSIHVSSFGAALVAALLLGLINAVIRPLLLLLTLPITVLTLGLFIFVLNGIMFWLAASVFDGFKVDSLWAGILGSVVFSLISWLLSTLILGKK